MTTPTRLYPPNGQQLTLHLSQGGQVGALVLGSVGLDDATPITAEFAAAWRDAAWSAFRPLIVSSVSCTGATLRDVENVEGTVAEVGAPATNAAGVNTATAALAAASTLIKWSTSRGGRSGKGRTYVPGVAGSAINADGRTYTANHQTATATAVTAYLGSAHWATYEAAPAVLSFTKGYATPITGGSLSQVVGVQRRRMR